VLDPPVDYEPESQDTHPSVFDVAAAFVAMVPCGHADSWH